MIFRNDDIDYRTKLEDLKKFSGYFHKYGFKQLHGVILRGQSDFDKVYPNDQIIAMAGDNKLVNNVDIINYINDSDDDVALHGLYHTFYHQMDLKQHKTHIEQGLSELQTLFPEKHIKYFICPDNQYNEHTLNVCRSHGLTVLHSDGIHLETHLNTEPDLSWVGKVLRYHYWRWFRHPNLSLSSLDKLLEKLFNIYTRHIEHYPNIIDEATTNSGNRALKKFLFSKLTGQSGKLLDIGCNSGWMMEKLQSQGFEVYGVEPADLARHIAIGKGLDVKKAFAENLPYPDNEFDVTLIASVLAQVSDVDQSLYEALRVTKPGGKIIGLAPTPSGGWGHSAVGKNAYVFNVIEPDYLIDTYNAHVENVDEHENYFEIEKNA